MISFEFTEEQKQIQALMKDVGEKETTRQKMDELADVVARAKTGEEVRELQPDDLYRKFHEVGLRQLAIPEKYGGGGLGFGHHVTRALVSEQSGYTMGIGARLLGMEWRKAFLPVAVGVLIAGVVVLLITLLVRLGILGLPWILPGGLD